VVLDHNTVIFQKEKGGVHIKITGMQDLTKKSTFPTQSFICPKKLIKITKSRE
jgi:hypothetical protein